MDLHLKGKSVVVTAASKGLGKASAVEFAKEGARVLISSRSEEDLRRAKEEIIRETGNENVDIIVCDMKKPAHITRLVKKAVEWNGKVDVLINNAGGPPAGTFEDFTDEDWQKAFELNLLSFTRTVREVLPHMKEQQSGHIINIASSSIKQTLDQLILSNTFRAGIVGLSKSLSQELAPHNILINTVGPGRIATDRVESLDRKKAEELGVSKEEVQEKAADNIPIKRYGKPEEFARAVVFLASGGNTYVTGQAIVVDGGLVKAL
ncbi:SDR family oxidoreductase [Halobacillus sp. A5]|uniref:SDR family oxidoreductase n=1 Tax=Halobacillus sp. A5 TaxID=2880263 RepID=UPI0020A65D2A|nr:SDR family oxidoreductase [Halobacillus sp. A5]MCP3026517.1 SDR family oxidoreductase [Halobacillus sp. A5]